MSLQTIVQTIDADAAKALAEVKAGLTYLDDEAKKVVAWVEKEVPGSAGAIAVFMTDAEAEAAKLAAHAAGGLSGYITAGATDIETFLGDLLNATHIDASGGLKAIDVSAVSLVESIAQGLVKTGLASILAKLAPAV